MILLTEGSLLVFLAATKLKSDYELLEAGQKCNTVYNMRKKLRKYKRIFIFSSARTTNSKTIRQHFLIEDGGWMASTNLGLTEDRWWLIGQAGANKREWQSEREGGLGWEWEHTDLWGRKDFADLWLEKEHMTFRWITSIIWGFLEVKIIKLNKNSINLPALISGKSAEWHRGSPHQIWAWMVISLKITFWHAAPLRNYTFYLFAKH